MFIKDGVLDARDDVLPTENTKTMGNIFTENKQFRECHN